MEAMPIQWLQEAPAVTSSYIVASLGLSVAESLGYIKVQDFIVKSDSLLLLDFNQIWKIPLNLVYNGPISADFCTKLYFFSRYSNWLESSLNSSSSYLWMIIIITALLQIYSALISPLGMLGPSLKDALLYICSKKNPGMGVMFLIIPFQGDWLPWVTTIINVASARSPDKKTWLYHLAGIVVGHFYWFIDEQIPLLHNNKSIFTPIWQWQIFQREQQPLQILPPPDQDLAPAQDPTDVPA